MAHPTKEYFLKLVDKFLENKASKREIEEIEGYYSLFSDSPEVLETIGELDLKATEQRLKNRISVKIKDQESNIKSINNVSVRSLWYRFAGAAIVLLGLSAGFYFYMSTHSSFNLKNAEMKNDITPGANKATLTLANGKKIELIDVDTGQISEHKGISVSKSSSGQLVYTISPTVTSNSSKISYNTLSTPRGGQYQIKLPDGTLVWLNSETVIKFPINFHGTTARVIKLQGEAYFEVSKIALRGRNIPLIVETKRQKVEVLGTHFNVNSYENERYTKTTLFEGSVRVTGNLGSEAILKPNEQSVLSAKGIEVLQVDAEKSIAWKNGKFEFVSEDIESIMRKIARWYDVEIIYKDELANMQFSGSFSRFENVSSVLRTIERTNTVHFKIEGRRILVMK